MMKVTIGHLYEIVYNEGRESENYQMVLMTTDGLVMIEYQYPQRSMPWVIRTNKYDNTDIGRYGGRIIADHGLACQDVVNMMLET